MVTLQVPASSIQNAIPEGQVPLVAPSQQGDEVQPVAEGGPQDSVELIEDKAIAAVNSIQEAAQQAAEMIQEAKQAPAPGQEDDIQEAQFSFSDYDDDYEERYFTDSDVFGDPMESWLSQI